MITDELLAFLYFVLVVMRWPRLKERWVAPLMRGPEWFFDVAVPSDFLAGPGAEILRRYRWRLFIPWATEAPIFAALLLTGQKSYLLVLMGAITLFTRFNYYAARIAAENQARRFEIAGGSEAPSRVVFSLQPRRLAGYSNRWTEAAIIVSTAAAIAWYLYLGATSPDPHLMRRLMNVAILTIYMHLGLLLVKREVIRSGGAAPVDNAEQYLAWRDSLRRFTAGVCDKMRLLVCLTPLQIGAIVTAGKQVIPATIGAILVATLIAIHYEWRGRRAYLEIARRTKPAKLPALADTGATAGPFCFWPSIPMLLLKTANGYALNLASSSVRMTGLYLAGFAGIWMLLI